MKIVVTSVLVDDQEKALRFYTDVLGFEKKHDVDLGEARWLTVVSPEDRDGTELLLEPDAHPAASPFKAAYVTAKHGVLGLTKTVALEVARTGVTCNAICPGFTRTPLAERQVAAAAQERGISEEEALTEVVLEKQPSKRWVEVEEVARLALYVCGPDTASLNGAALSIDGGWIAA